MTSSVPVAVAAAALALAAPLAQSKPDFSGTWTMDRERSESPHQTASFEPPTFVISQTEADVTIETRRGSASSQVRYPIASATTAAPAGAGGGARAYWSGASLVTESNRTVQGQTVSVRETRSLDASGAEMTVETLLVVQHGYSFKGGQNYGAAKDVYRKVNPKGAI
jgi:hypothetical protein